MQFIRSAPKIWTFKPSGCFRVKYFSWQAIYTHFSPRRFTYISCNLNCLITCFLGSFTLNIHPSVPQPLQPLIERRMSANLRSIVKIMLDMSTKQNYFLLIVPSRNVTRHHCAPQKSWFVSVRPYYLQVCLNVASTLACWAIDVGYLSYRYGWQILVGHSNFNPKWRFVD